MNTKPYNIENSKKYNGRGTVYIVKNVKTGEKREVTTKFVDGIINRGCFDWTIEFSNTFTPVCDGLTWHNVSIKI